MSNVHPEILRLLQVDPEALSIIALWSNQEVRRIDFAPMFKKWRETGETELLRLEEPKKFKAVSISASKTLQWRTVRRAFTWKGQTSYRATELDPYVLFDQSVLIKQEQPLTGNLLRTAREKSGMSQTDLAQKSHTTADFISKVESGEKVIPLEDLQIIVEQGLGKKLRLEIQ